MIELRSFLFAKITNTKSKYHETGAIILILTKNNKWYLLTNYDVKYSPKSLTPSLYAREKTMNFSILNFWEKLKTVQALSLRSRNENDWNGFAEVFASSKESETILFYEKGLWKNNKISFTNTLRWTLYADGISLEHLRFGFEFPVSLVHFTLKSKNWLVSINPHLCGRDKYFGQIVWNQEGIHLHWNVQGPLKTEEIYSFYT